MRSEDGRAQRSLAIQLDGDGISENGNKDSETWLLVFQFGSKEMISWVDLTCLCFGKCKGLRR